MVQVTNGDVFAKMKRNLSQLQAHEVDIGYFAGESSEPNGTDTAAVAAFQEFGTSRGIPSRPFLRQTLDTKAPEWGRAITPEIIQVMLGGSVNVVYQALGHRAVNDVRETIDAGNFAPLSPATIHAKGHAKPLIDSSTMYAATNFKVR